MAEPLTPTGSSLELFDQAVRLLRQAPFATLLCHWVGSAPLALALMFFRNQVARPRVPASTIAWTALSLTLVLLWMNCWRSVFAGRLRRQLSGAVEPAWTARRVFRLITAQAWFGATKLYVLPLSSLVLFTAANTIAFYRIVAVLADHEDLDPLHLRARARHIAASARRDNWTILPILLFLQVVVAINFTIVLALLPHIFRIVTGIETSFSRGGMVFVTNPLFTLLVLAVSWLAFDPFAQAVYCVRCFRAESFETGEDVRAGLRRIRAAMQVAAASILFLIAVPGRAADAVSPQQLDQAIKLAEQSHEYDWRLPPDAAASAKKESWIVDATDRAMARLRKASRSVRNALLDFFKWLNRQFGVAAEPAAGKPPASALHWSVYLLIGLLIAAAAWVVWQKRSARRTKSTANLAPTLAVRLNEDDLAPDRLPEEQWLELAARCLGEQNFRLALRAYYLANLAWLGRSGFLTIHAGKTNREYELELRRKARTFGEARGWFAMNVEAFERAWYGLHEVAPQDIDEFRARLERMKTTLALPKETAA